MGYQQTDQCTHYRYPRREREGKDGRKLIQINYDKNFPNLEKER